MCANAQTGEKGWHIQETQTTATGAARKSRTRAEWGGVWGWMTFSLVGRVMTWFLSEV